MRKLLSSVFVGLLVASTALADPVPLEEGQEPSPWTLPIAIAVLIAVVALIVIWRRRR